MKIANNSSQTVVPKVRPRRRPSPETEMMAKYNQVMALNEAHRAKAARARHKHTEVELEALCAEVAVRRAVEIALHEVEQTGPRLEIKEQFKKHFEELSWAHARHLNWIQEAYAHALVKAGMEGYSSVTWKTEELLARVNLELGLKGPIKPHKLYAAMRACEEIGATGHKRRANRPSIRWALVNWRAPISL